MCHLSLDDGFDESKGWECSIVCKKFTKEQKEALLLLKGTFDNSVETIRPLLQHLDDGCGQGHHSKTCLVESSSGETSYVVRELMGHPMHCASNPCHSQLRLLRAGAVHYPALRTLLKQIYCAKRSSALIDKVESDLSSVSSIQSLKQNLGLEDLANMLQYDEFYMDAVEKLFAGKGS